MSKLDPSFERNVEGAWVVTALVDDGRSYLGPYYLTERYYGYTKAEAARLFRAHCDAHNLTGGE